MIWGFVHSRRRSYYLFFNDRGGHLIDPESVLEVTADLEIQEDGGLTVQTEMDPLAVLTISTHGQGELVSGSVKVVSEGLPIGGGLRYNLPAIAFNGGGKTCRISSKAIYRALDVENIRHRRDASKPLVMRRLLSLDFVLEHPGMNWLPAEPEKVKFFEKIGLPLRLLPRRIYYGVVGNQKRYFALKLPLAVDPEIVTFVYADPGHQTGRELYSWGAAHGPLWDALRKKGRQVRVIGIGVENTTVDRTDRVLERWAEAEPGTSHEGLTPRQEIKAIRDAMKQKDREFLAPYGGFGGAMERLGVLYKMPEAKVTEGVSIDDYSTYRATRLAERDEIG